MMSTQSINLEQLMKILWINKKLMIITIIIVTALGFSYSLVTKPLWRSTITITNDSFLYSMKDKSDNLNHNILFFKESNSINDFLSSQNIVHDFLINFNDIKNKDNFISNNKYLFSHGEGDP